MNEILDVLSDLDGYKLILAGIVLIISMLVVKILKNIVDNFLNKHCDGLSESTKFAVTHGLYTFMGSFFAVTVLKILGIEWTGSLLILTLIITSFIGMINITIDDFSSGLILLRNGDFKAGDFLMTEGFEGYIKKVSFLVIELEQEDGVPVYAPSSTIAEQKYSVMKSDTPYMLSKNIPVSNRYAVEEVRDDLFEAVYNSPGVLQDEDNSVRLTEITHRFNVFDCSFYCSFEDRYDVEDSVMTSVSKVISEKYKPSYRDSVLESAEEFL